jgi:hypothetical protein
MAHKWEFIVMQAEEQVIYNVKQKKTGWNGPK